MYIHEYIKHSTLEYRCKYCSLELKHKLFDSIVIGDNVAINLIIGIVAHEEIDKDIECFARKMIEAIE